jgi:predicted P-loop ATPase
LLRQKVDNALRYANGRPGELLKPEDFIRYVSGPRTGQIVANNQRNIQLALEKMGFAFRFNAFAGVALMSLRVGDDFSERPLDDAGLESAWLLADRRFGFRPSLEFFGIVVKDLARRTHFHPVKDYLADLAWDGRPRIDKWLCQYGGAEDNAYTTAVASKVLIAAVRRVRVPGAKFDELPICETPIQGTNKSSALAALCPRSEWFGDDLPLGVDSKQVIERTSGKWLIEAGELHGYSNAQVEKLKGMLSRQVDGPVRMAYGRIVLEVARQFILIGTTNEVTDYLRDTTGNRRFWPVRVARFDVQAIKRDRDQLWAEAAQREAAGESIRLPEELWAVAAVEQEARRSIDPWEELLDDSIDFASDVVLVNELWTALGTAGSYRKRNDAERLSRIMQRQGFTRRKKVDVVYVRQGVECRAGKLDRRWAWTKDGKDPIEVVKQGGPF